jgi:AcrR family transcriptional regulator
MPRKADSSLEARVVDAAYELWSRGGEHALTMRAVAKAAKTTTPTLYERFKDKHDLINFLRERARQRFFAAVQPAKTALEICRLALRFTERFGNEYLLLTAEWSQRFGRNLPKPSFDLLREKLAQEVGGAPEENTKLALMLFLQVHGAAVALEAEGIQPEVVRQLEDACIKGCETLIECGWRRARG